MTPGEFVTGFVAYLDQEAARLRTYGAEAQAATCEKNAADLGARFQAFWLENLTIEAAAAESGYAPESLREMARDGRLPHVRAGGEGGHYTVRRCDLPIRPKPKAPEDKMEALALRLLRPRDTAA